MTTRTALREQNRRFRGTGGVSRNGRLSGFVPAFVDTLTGAVYRSRFADGRPAPLHLLDGLPADLVEARSASGRVIAVKDTVIAGFLRCGRFYTREQMALGLKSHQRSVRSCASTAGRGRAKF